MDRDRDAIDNVCNRLCDRAVTINLDITGILTGPQVPEDYHGQEATR
jgi:hypothetical protein